MDERDKKILAELDRNPRISEKKLGRKLRLSQQVVSYRITKLIDDKTISKITPIYDLNALGLEHYRVFFRFHQISDKTRHAIFEYLKKQTPVFWAARIGGRYDLLVVLFVKNYLYFDRFMESLVKEFPNTFRDYEAVYGLYHEYYVHKYLAHAKTPEPLAYYTYNPPQTIDGLDTKIMHAIKENGRQSALSIGQKLGVTYKTVQNRLKSLQKRKILLGYRVFTRSEEFKSFIALISFKEYSKQKEERLITELRAHKNITQCVRLFGKWQ